jgi:two-component system, NtrC family, sensor histidine kinase PilS
VILAVCEPRGDLGLSHFATPFVRHTPSASSQQALQAFLDPRRLLRWMYIGRMTIASAIFIAAVFSWFRVDEHTTLFATLAFVVSAMVTGVSAGYTTVYHRAPGLTFLYLQFISDLLLVTIVVHTTGPAGVGGPTVFSALYILVITMAALLLPERGSLLVAALGILLYFTDIRAFQNELLQEDPQALYLQLAVFAVVALSTAALSERLRGGTAGTALLATHLEQVRLRAEDILRNINSGVITIDPEGRLMYANPMAERLLDISLKSQANQFGLDQLKAKAPALGEALESSARDRTRTNREESRVVSNGREFPIGVTTTFMEDATGHVTATAIFQDISDSKRMETLRIRAERLEGVAELSASLAHEIKNPLASIRSSVEQISKMPHPGDDERQLAALVMRESDRLSRLLTEFLDFARVRVARADLVNLGDVARGVCRLVSAHPDAGEGVRVECIVPDAAVVVNGDEDMLHRALFNLALNAVQASPPQSLVTVEVLTDLSESAEEGSVADGSVGLRVTDHGSGIPDEIRARLFDPFTTTKPQGTGLGLAVVHRAIVAHKGLVLVDSGPQGTRVTVVLPNSVVTAPVFA